MKKLMISLFSLVLAATMLLALASCDNTTTDNKETSGTNAPASSSHDTEAPKGTSDDTTAAPESTSEDTTAAPEVKVEVGTVLDYKMAFYLDEAEASNATDDLKKFVQNISNGYARIDDEFMLNDEDTYQLFWPAETEGNTFTIPVEVPVAGKYTVALKLHNGGDFGQFQFFLGETLISGSEAIDCYNTAGGLYDYDLGEFELAEGEVELVVRCTGKNEASAGVVFAISSMTLTCTALNG